MELVLSVSIVALGIFIMVEASGFPTLSGGYPGPGLFPQILGALFILFGLWVVLQQVRRRAWPRWPRPFFTRERINALLVVLAVILYLLVVEYVGFILTVVCLLAGLMLSLGVRWRTSILLSIALTMATYLLFNKLLGVPLPAGLVEGWF
ncbi:MAG: tripartite tricarboxylate transporter TctB family protein [Nitrospinota bacterium]|nr:MAG: tripartite tricarboxylate transporter TctB family protein [Nitrospinota bacterium]